MVRVHSAKGLRNAELIGKSDPYCVVSFSKGEVVSVDSQKTKWKKDTNDPVWEEEFAFLVSQELKNFTLTVKDDNIGVDASQGSLTVSTVCSAELEQEAPLNPQGIIKYGYKLVPLVDIVDRMRSKSSRSARKAESKTDDDTIVHRLFGGFEKLVVFGVRAAFNLKDADWFGKSDSYATITWEESKRVQGGNHTDQTKIFSGTLSPVWLEGFSYLVQPKVEKVIVTLKDKDFIGSDTLGRADVMLPDKWMAAKEQGISPKGKLLYDCGVVELSDWSIGEGVKMEIGEA
jgi:Ca2+-dependent lipid-binding protein